MAIFKAVNLRIGKRKRSNLAGIIKYVLKTEKTDQKLVYGQNLEIPRAYDMMMETKETFGKKTLVLCKTDTLQEPLFVV